MALFAEQSEQDVACVSGWWAESSSEIEKIYKDLTLPKVPLLLATLEQHQEKHAKALLQQEGWRKVGWYPSCHYDLEAKGNNVSIFCKEQDFEPKPVPAQKYPRSPFNVQLPLSCSCNPYATMVKLTLIVDRHRTLGIHRHTAQTFRKTFNNWHRFAVTPLASYWFWGLLPKETNRRKYE